MNKGKETWKGIKGFPKYEISDLGRVRRLHWRNPHLITGRIIGKGYYQVSLYRGEGEEGFLIHRLVLEAFIGLCPSGYQTNHKNGKKRDNRVSNLEWVTSGENMAHSFRIGLRTHKGIMNSNARLQEKDVLQIRTLAEKGIKQSIIAETFKMSSGHVNDIVRRRTWVHI